MFSILKLKNKLFLISLFIGLVSVNITLAQKLHKDILSGEPNSYSLKAASYNLTEKNINVRFKRNRKKDEASSQRPNIIIMFVDDLGYGDLSCYGNPLIRTPNLDKMADSGVKLTSFYSAASKCTPSRAALLTGRYPIRFGLTKVLNANSENGLSPDEFTLAEALKSAGYRTACIGKWHLGNKKEFMPSQQGFDTYYGIPYSNDNDSKTAPANTFLQGPPTPLMRGEKIIEQPVDMATTTQKYTTEALSFIKKNKKDPFFMYLAYTMPHVPIAASERFKGKSKAGLYGDVVEELDWSVGQILQTLEKENLSKNTLIVFTSDNGPFLNIDAIRYDAARVKRWHSGSAGPYKGGKFSIYEGGYRVPGIIQWKGSIPEGQVLTDPATTMDLFATCLNAAGKKLPDDRVIDGNNLLPMLQSKSASPTKIFYYFGDEKLEAVRSGNWKYIYSAHIMPGSKAIDPVIPELYNLKTDFGEKFNVAKEYPEVVKELQKLMDEAKLEIKSDIKSNKN